MLKDVMENKYKIKINAKIKIEELKTKKNSNLDKWYEDIKDLVSESVDNVHETNKLNSENNDDD